MCRCRGDSLRRTMLVEKQRESALLMKLAVSTSYRWAFSIHPRMGGLGTLATRSRDYCSSSAVTPNISRYCGRVSSGTGSDATATSVACAMSLSKRPRSMGQRSRCFHSIVEMQFNMRQNIPVRSQRSDAIWGEDEPLSSIVADSSSAPCIALIDRSTSRYHKHA